MLGTVFHSYLSEWWKIYTTLHYSYVVIEYLGGEGADQEVGLGQEVYVKYDSS